MWLQVIILDVQHEHHRIYERFTPARSHPLNKVGKLFFCIASSHTFVTCYTLCIPKSFHTDFPNQNDWIFEIQIVQYMFEQVFKELVLGEWAFANVRISNFWKIYAIHFNLKMWWTDWEIESECWALNACRYLFCCAASSYDSSSPHSLSSSTCDPALTQCRLNFYNSAMIRF